MSEQSGNSGGLARRLRLAALPLMLCVLAAGCEWEDPPPADLPPVDDAPVQPIEGPRVLLMHLHDDARDLPRLAVLDAADGPVLAWTPEPHAATHVEIRTQGHRVRVPRGRLHVPLAELPPGEVHVRAVGEERVWPLGSMTLP